MIRSRQFHSFVWLLVVSAGTCDGREWSQQGRILSGEFERLRGDEVVIRQGSHRVVIAIAELSDKDQAFIASLTKERVWTNAGGKQIVASFLGRDGEHVTIRREGREFTIPIQSLAQSEQFYLERRHPWSAMVPDDPVASLKDPLSAQPEATQPEEVVESGRVRVWTQIGGKEIRGRFSRMTGSLVWLHTDAGEKPVPLGVLSKQDQEFVRKLQGDSDAEYQPSESSSTTVDVPSTNETPIPDPPAASEGDIWVLRDGTSVTGTFQKLQGNLVWLSRNPGVTVLPLHRFTGSDHQRILRLSAAAILTPDPLVAPQRVPARMSEPISPREPEAASSHDTSAAAEKTVNQGTTCSNCGMPGYIRPGERCPHCGKQKHWSQQLRVGEAPTQFGTTPGLGSSDDNDRIRFRPRGLIKLAIAIFAILGTAMAGFLKFLFGSGSTKRN
ncbi:MAG: hypothetical protein H8E66_25080 [Planctomycetes bacterium]|nr:hypothetical protein [Planctomycetota bacterium]